MEWRRCERLRPPHDDILAAMDILAGWGAEAPDGAFRADVAKVRQATERLLSLQQPAAPASSVITPTALAQAEPAAPQRSAAAAPSRGRILVVDDVEDNRDVLMRHLKRQGYDVESARDGAEALRLADETSFDLMLLDVRMPGIDGQEVLTRIKKDAGTRDLPVVMISAADELATIA